MDKINNLPKPVVISVVVVVVLLAAVIVFRSVKGGGANDGYGSKKEIMEMQKNGRAHTDTNGH